jgi:hypothetical protein
MNKRSMKRPKRWHNGRIIIIVKPRDEERVENESDTAMYLLHMGTRTGRTID